VFGTFTMGTVVVTVGKPAHRIGTTVVLGIFIDTAIVGAATIRVIAGATVVCCVDVDVDT